MRFPKIWYSIFFSSFFLLLVGFIIFGVFTNYFLNDDLPAHIAVVNELNNLGTFYGNPYIENNGLPDFHTGPYYMAVYLIDSVIGFNLVNLGLNLQIEGIVTSYLLVGLISVIILLLGYVSVLKSIKKSIIFIILGLSIFIVSADLPLLRWAGNLSLHGLSYQFYYPQFFGIALSTIIIYLNERYRNECNRKILILSIFFSWVLFLSHILTGLLSLAVSFLQLVIFSSIENKKKIIALMSFGAVPFVSVVLWPFFPVNLTLKSTNAYPLLILLCVGISVFYAMVWLFETRIKMLLDKIYTLFSRIKIERIIVYSHLILLSFTLYNYNHLTSYFSFHEVNFWWLIYAPLFSGLLFIFSKDVVRKPIFPVLLMWSYGGVFLYALGAFGGIPVKVYWRFLFLVKLPLSILIAYAWYKEISRKNILATSLLPFLFLILYFGAYLQMQTMISSQTSSYFKKIPQEYAMASFFKDINHKIILSDPYTSYFLSGLSNNKVYSVDTNRVCDYDQPLLAQREQLFMDFFVNFNSGALKKIIDEGEIDYIVINKTLLYDNSSLKMIRGILPEKKVAELANLFYEINAKKIYSDDAYNIYEL